MNFVRQLRDLFHGRLYQSLAVLFCLLLGLAMVLNNQMGGEAMWFWYATVFHSGAKLYADLHLALQPLFVLETDVWMRVLGNTLLAYEFPSILHILAACFAMFLVLRESDWPDWQKALVLAGAFALTVAGNSYRFDDYHILSESFIFYSAALLLILARTQATALRKQLLLIAALGVLSGLTITTRLNDGVAFLGAAAVCLLFIAPRQKLGAAALYLVIALLTVIVVVKLTGDTLSDYITNTVIKAAGSKGGTHSFLADPWLLLTKSIYFLRVGSKRVLICVFAVVAVGALVQRRWKLRAAYVVLLELALAVAIIGLSSPQVRDQMLNATLLSDLVLAVIVLTYLLPVVIATRFILSRVSPATHSWDPRETLFLIPLAEWASASAASSAEPLTQYYAPVAVFLLLVAVVRPLRKQPVWAVASFVTLMAVFAMVSVTNKVNTPYAWQHYKFSPMFQDRVWYRHPVYGPMYIDRNLLAFSEAVCNDIQARGPVKPELLSLPYPFPNYFCATPPWRGYVQTFFDTSTRSTIDHLMQQLDADPPQWIVYQRQLDIMTGAERLYNHGQPIAQRDLDNMIFRKIAVGQWQLVDQRTYLKGDGWFIIKTHP